MIARAAASLVLALVLTACGDFRVEQPKDEQEDDDSEELGGHDETSDDEKPAGNATDEPSDNSDHDTAPAVAVQVDVAVSVTVAADDADLEAVRYAPRRRAWQDAVDQAPAGYRLATRAELVALVDAGELEDLDASGGPAVWSATERDDHAAQLVELESGRSAPCDKAVELAALYVRNAP